MEAKTGGPQYSMPGKNPIVDEKKVPGPGMYRPVDFEQKPTSGPKYSMGTGPKDVKDTTGRQQVPGPGGYIHKIEHSKIGGKFGTDSKNKEVKNSNPGPGNYSMPNPIGSMPSYAKRN